MKPILYINGYQIDLAENAIISQTKQINDIANLDTRESNYTNSFKAVKNENNLRAFNMMTLVASKSRVPYQKNTASLYSSSGECFIYNGFAKITDSGDAFDIVIYDGIIDFFKAIENKTLSSLDLTELNHLKTEANIYATWNETLSPYKYIFADFNGKTFWDLHPTRINTDYLVPSVRVKYLWDKIFDSYGVQYSGSIFTSDEFERLYMTFPKGLPSIESSEYTTMFNGTDSGNDNLLSYRRYINLQGFLENDGFDKQGSFYISKRNQSVKIKFSGQLNIIVSGTTNEEIDVYLLRNYPITFNVSGTNPYVNFNNYGEYLFTAKNGEAIDFEKTFTLNRNENISFVYDLNQFSPSFVNKFRVLTGNTMTVNVATSIGQNIDFEQPFIDFQIKDFIKEIINRFGLTIYPNKTGDAYEFLTIAERLNTLEVTDWTDKFPIKKGTNYTLQGYARKNTFRYKYNDTAADYNDGVFFINDFNLPESKQVFESRVYTVERFRSIILGRSVNVYKLYEKEPSNGDDPITYKPLDKRFYFLKSNFVTIDSFRVGSESLNSHVSRTTISIEDYSRMSLQDTFQDYYNQFGEIVNDFKLESWQVYLNDADILNLNLKSKIFLQQESSYYLLNRLLNYVPYKPTVVELIKLKDSLGFTPFQAVEFKPFGNVSVSEPRPVPSILFNKNIIAVIPSNTIFGLVCDYDTDEDVGGVSFNPLDISGNYIFGTIDLDIAEVGKKYYILLPANQLQSIDGEPFEITNKDVWTFTVTA